MNVSTNEADLAQADSTIEEIGPPQQKNRMWLIRLVSIVVTIAAWEWFGRQVEPLFMSYPSAIAVAAALFWFFRRTRTGAAIRACADNLVGAGVVGLNVKRLYALTFGLGLACVGAAGALLVTIADPTPSLGPSYTLIAFIIVIIGGLGSMAGALVGGVLIGVSEALAGFLFAPSMKSMFSFALLIAVLVLRPQGLMGRRI